MASLTLVDKTGVNIFTKVNLSIADGKVFYQRLLLVKNSN